MRDEHQASVGRLIARLRDHRGWSQRALAKWVGLDQSAISRIEAGRRRIQADELRRFADALGVSADDLLLGEAAAAHADISLEALQAPPVSPHLLRQDDHLVHHERGVAFESPGGDLDAFEVGADAILDDASDQGPVDSALLQYASHKLAFPSAARSSRELRLTPGFGDRFFRPELASGSVTACPPEVAAVVNDWFTVHMMTDPTFVPGAWEIGHTAEGKPTRGTWPPARFGAGPGSPDALPDRLARFWRGELRIEQDDGPVPDLVPLLEDSLGIQVIVARVKPRTMPPGGATGGAPGGVTGGQGAEAGDRAAAEAAEQPVCAALTVLGTRFLFVNAARPVALQRFALVHALGHLLLNHGDVVDQQIEWNRNNPLEATANDFAEEFLAPVRAVRGWYDRRDAHADDGRRAPGGERRGPWSSERRVPPPSGPRELPVNVGTLLELANAFGITPWAALFRTRVARRLHPKQFGMLRAELRAKEPQLLPRQAFLGGLRDTLVTLTPDEAAPPGEYGPPAILRVPGAMRRRALVGIRRGRMSLERAAELLRLPPPELEATLARLGVE